MQLPQKRSAGVANFAAVPSAAAASAAQSKMQEGLALSGAIGDIGEGVQTQANLMLDREEKHEKLSVGMQRANFLKMNADKPYYSPDEIHPDIIVPGGRTKNVTDENGETIQVPRRIPQAEVFPAMYERHMKGAIATSSSNIHSRRRSREFFEAETAAAFEEHAEISVKAEQVMLKTYRAEQDTQITTLAEAGDKEAALEAARSYPGSDLERAEKVTEVNLTIEQNHINDLKATEAKDLIALGDIEYEIAQLRDLDNVSRTMPDDARLEAANTLERVSYNNLQNIKATEKRERAKVIGDLELKIHDDPNSSSVGEINALYELGSMSDPKRVQLIKSLEVAQKSQTKAAQDYNRASWYMLNDTKIAKEDKGVQKGLDNYFRVAVEEGADPSQEAIRIAHQTGYIVEHARFTITAANSGYNPQMKDGLMLYADIARTDPNALRYMPKEETNRIKTVMGHMKSGKLTFEQALDVQRSWELKSEAERQVIKEQFEGEDYRKESGSALKSLIGDAESMQVQGFTEFQPDIPAVMQREFEINVRNRLPSMGYDLAAAQAAEFETIQAEWGLTNVDQLGVESGRTSNATFMKYAPEGSKAEIAFSLEHQYGEGEYVINSDAVSDVNHQNGDPISYEVYKIDPDTGAKIREENRWVPVQTEAERTKLSTDVAIDTARKSDITGIEADIKRLEASRVRLKESTAKGLTSNESAAKRMDVYNEKIANKEAQLAASMQAREDAKPKPPEKPKADPFNTPPIPVLNPGSTVTTKAEAKAKPKVQEIEPEMDDDTKLRIASTNISSLYEARYRLLSAMSSGVISESEGKSRLADLDSSISQTEKELTKLVAKE